MVLEVKRYMPNMTQCERCDANMVDKARPAINFQLYIRGGEQRKNQFCAVCLEEIAEFVFESDVDRSDKVEPISVDELERDIDRYIEDLEKIKSTIQAKEIEEEEKHNLLSESVF